MKNSAKKAWAFILKHKVLSIAITFVLIASIVAASLLLSFKKPTTSQPAQASLTSGITRGEWITCFTEKFGYKEYQETTPFFEDVQSDDTLFPQAQAMVENGLTAPGGKLEPDNIISGNQMLFDIGKAFGKDYVARRVENQEPTQKQYVQFLIEAEPKLKDFAVEKGLNADQVGKMLDIAHQSYLNREYDNFADIDLAEEVLDLSQTTYTAKNGSYTIESEEAIKKGDIVILGVSESDPDGETLKVETVSSVGNKYTITGSQPELEEVYDEFELEINQIAAISEFQPAEGVTITEIDQENGVIDVVWNGTTQQDTAVTTLSNTNSYPTTTPLVSGSMNQDINGTLFNIKGKWSSDGTPLVATPKFFDILEQNPLYKNDVDVALDKDGNLVNKYDKGYELSLGLKVSDLILNGTATYKTGFLGTNKRLAFDINAGLTVEPTVSLAGNASAKFKLGTFNVPVNILLSVKVDVYLLMDVNGEITVTTKIVSKANVNKSLESSKINASAKVDAYTELEANCDLKLLIGPDPTLTLAGIQIVDAYVLMGVGAKTSYTTERANQLDVNVYLPLIQAGVGYNPQTLLSKLGVAAGVNVMDKEGALLKCPFDKVFTFELCKEEAKPVIEGVHHKFEDGTLTIYGTGKMENHLVDGVENTPYGQYADSLEKIVIEDGITYVGDASFAHLPNLTTVEMADSVTSAGNFVFQGCTKLKNVRLSNKLTGYNPKNEDECTNMFSGCTALESIELPDSFTVVPWSMFHECTSLKNVKLSKNITSIGYLSFAFSGIEKITLPSRVTKIEEGAFFCCEQLKEVVVEGELSVIERDAFYECTSLKNVPQVG